MLGQRLGVEQDSQSLMAPPRFELEGIDLVTEGAITLNQVYNVLDEPLDKLTEDSGVTELCTFLQLADRVNIFLGGANESCARRYQFPAAGHSHPRPYRAADCRQTPRGGQAGCAGASVMTCALPSAMAFAS